MRKGFVKTGYTSQGNKTAHGSSRRIAYLILQKEYRCECCGSTRNVDVHHKDKDYHNNNPENLQMLCRSCHMKAHSEKGVCVICGAPMKGHGYCNKHLIMWRKYGDPLHKPWSRFKERASKGPVLQYTKDGELVATYKDLRTAARETSFARSSIACACNGNRKSLNGYIWKYGNKD